MLAHLWADAPAPFEYIELILKRDVYHCTTSQLRAENFRDVLTDLKCMEVEAEFTRVQKNRTRRAT